MTEVFLDSGDVGADDDAWLGSARPVMGCRGSCVGGRIVEEGPGCDAIAGRFAAGEVER